MTISAQQDFRHPLYVLDVQIHPDSNQIDTTVSVKNPPDASFYLHKDFVIHSITTKNGSLPFTRLSNDCLPYTVGSAVIIDGEHPDGIQIQYTGTLDQAVQDVNMIAPDLVELASYAAWYPLFKSQVSFEFELTVDLPSGYCITTNGICTQEEKVGTRDVSKWESSALCTDIVVVASPHFRSMRAEQMGTQVEVLFSETPEDYITAKRDCLVTAMDRLSDYYGATQTGGLLRYVNSPRSGWGYARVPLFVVSEEYALMQLDRDFGQARDFHGAAHELAHFWWLIANTNTPDDWINEGLAEYSAFRLSEEFFGDTFAKILVQEYRKHAAQSQTDTPIAETPLSSADRYVNRYEKTALIFIEARLRYGQDELDHVLKTIYARYARTREATTKKFLNKVNRGLGTEAAEFFRHALYQRDWKNPQELW